MTLLIDRLTAASSVECDRKDPCSVGALTWQDRTILAAATQTTRGANRATNHQRHREVCVSNNVEPGQPPLEPVESHNDADVRLRREQRLEHAVETFLQLGQERLAAELLRCSKRTSLK
jgi:hypothetical protein